MKDYIFIIGLIFLCASSAQGFTCDRTPKKADNPKSNVDKYIIEVVGNPESYSPGEIYTIVLKSVVTTSIRRRFSEFMLVVEPENPSEALQNVLSGDLTPVDYTIARFTPRCPNSIIQTNKLAKHEVQIFWRAPPSGNGCIAIKATVYESSDSWYADDGGLTKILCEEVENEDVQPLSLEECSACNEAKYEVAFQGMWTRNTHPKDYPRNMWTTKLGEVIGASHRYARSFWNYDSTASEGLKLLAEEGNSTLLEDELKEMVKNDDIRTIIKARELSYPNIMGTSYTVFRVDQQHHLISLVSKITPSPDWIVGVANMELCTEGGKWIESRTINLYPWDVGTDDGKSYTDPNEPTIPYKPIRKLTAMDENTPFYSPDGKVLKPIAKVRITRQKVYEKPCESVEETRSDDSCQLSEWSQWSNCSTTCGNRVVTRDRQFIHPENTDRCKTDNTLILQQTEPLENCKQHDSDCEKTLCATANATWSKWSPCSASCGIGIKTRHRTIPFLEDIEYESSRESESTSCFEVVECYNAPCNEETGVGEIKFPVSSESQVRGTVVDCKVSRWSDWSPCVASKSSKNAYQEKRRHIEVLPKNGGKSCPKRLQKRKRCEALSNSSEKAGDNRKIDCKMGPWSKWSPCSSNCGSSAVQQRTRSIEQYPRKGGKPCGSRIQTKICPLPYVCNDRGTFNLNQF